MLGLSRTGTVFERELIGSKSWTWTGDDEFSLGIERLTHQVIPSQHHADSGQTCREPSHRGPLRQQDRAEIAGIDALLSAGTGRARLKP